MLTLDQARGIAASAWCKKETENTVMNVELCEVFAQMLVDNQFGQVAAKIHEAMRAEFPDNPDVARVAARVAIGIMLEGLL